MDRDVGNDAAASRSNGRLPSTKLVVSHDGRKPLFPDNATTRGLRNGNASNQIRSATASVGTGHGPNAPPPGAGAPRGGLARRANSEPQGAASEAGHAGGKSPRAGTPGGSRIPRLELAASQGRRPISLAEAFKIAQEEEEEAERARQLGGSPSPAPRPWRARPSGQPEDDEAKARPMPAAERLHSKGATRPSGQARRGVTHTLPSPDARARPGQAAAAAAVSSGSLSRRWGNALSLEERVNEWRQHSPAAAAAAAAPTPAATAAAHPPRAVPCPDALGYSSEDGRLPDLVPGIEDMAFGSPNRRFGIASPSKDFTWQVEQDFTAGDLQVSDSPRIRAGNNSNKPFANRPSIFAKGAGIDSPARVIPQPEPVAKASRPGSSRGTGLGNGLLGHDGAAGLSDQPTARKYARLDELRQREAAVEKQMAISDRNTSRARNAKIDQLRQWEAKGLSKRALAAARLEEIKEQNAMARPPPPDGQAVCGRPSSRLADRGEHVPDTPVTIFKSYRSQQENLDPMQPKLPPLDANDANAEAKPGQPRSTNERDLLRRLARAASASGSPAPPPVPAVERQKRSDDDGHKAAAKPLPGGRLADNDRKSAPGFSSTTARDKDGQPPRPTVGFAGLRRANSAGSAKSKRSSMHSESDPTVRIEAEMKLFAPHENHSERGSVRAPSPQPGPEGEEEGQEGGGGEDEEEEEEEEEGQANGENDKAEDGDASDLAQATPRPQKHDFLSLPTPRVTGAYVETPVTTKTGEIKGEEEEEGEEEGEGEQEQEVKPFKEKLREQREREQVEKAVRPNGAVSPEPIQDVSADRDRPSSGRLADAAAAAAAAASATTATASTAAAKRPRSRSTSRKRQPLKNSAKLPSVKDDLRELQRQHNIDDSTVDDDIEEILSGRKHPSPKLTQLLQELPARSAGDVDDAPLKALDDEVKQEPAAAEDKDVSETESVLFSKMSRTLRAGLSNIRVAKIGIERLQDQVAQTEAKAPGLEEDRPTEAPKAAARGAKQKQHQHQHQHRHRHHDKTAPDADADAAASPPAYLVLPVPRLYRTAPRAGLTLWGLLLAVLSAWYAAEWAMCARYCRPTTCGSAPCVYSYDDPAFGYALPVKLDQWTTGGAGRGLAHRAAEQVQDWVADLDDALRGRSLQDVAVERLTAEERLQHRRRLRKRGLLRPPARAPGGADQQAKWDAWRRSRLAREQRAREARATWAPDEAIGGDERVW
ncbi:uncharacterized protein UV8b_00063 [Ustilaginoidea virens]|uniref:Uncharacterized protein n=1 Tax=Ustilaginoidea virens TaxID=1159556 RepID=A0A8E5HIE5_USTVR|nr:uncharacterized protein UV8b_00063 [Ustilaginoidea virens]QUC15822.1 hypothetical protein UV8b_00063 [Ustilaginoidea virens]